MSTETAVNEAPSSTSTEMPSPMQETPSSTVENIPQTGDFASWLSDRLDNFQKGDETPPWEQKEAETEKSETVEDVEAQSETPETEPEAEAEEVEESDADTKNMSGSAGAKFKELKAELKSYKTKVAEAERLLEEAKSSSTNSEEVETLRSKLAEYEQEIAVTRVEATPEYKRAVLEPTQAILDSVASLADRYKVDARKLVNALREESANEGSDALPELAGDFSERDRVRLYRMADDLADVSRRRDFLRENASKAYEEQQQKMQAQEQQMEKAYRENASRTAQKVWESTFVEHPIFSQLGEETLKDISSAGPSTDLLDSSPDERAYAVYAGLALPHVAKQYQAAVTKAAELEKALAKYKKASPKVSGNTDTAPAVTDEGGFLDALEKRFSNG